MKQKHPAPLTTTWLTPPTILSALGAFDLDPCACPQPRPWATATTMWEEADNPLTRVWTGRVWLNPPFSPQAVQGGFLRRMAQHKNGIALLFSRTETMMFHHYVWGAGAAVLFLAGRPYFHHRDGSRAKGNSGAPVMLVAYSAKDAEILKHCGLAGKWVAL